MPFTSGNTLWKDSHKARKDNSSRLEEFMVQLKNEGTNVYATLLVSLAENKELTKPQKEFMDRFEGWREFLAAKLARTELTGKDGVELQGTMVYLPTVKQREVVDVKEVEPKRID